MSGRAGRRGKDDKGLCIMMVEESLDVDTCRHALFNQSSNPCSIMMVEQSLDVDTCRRALFSQSSNPSIDHALKPSWPGLRSLLASWWWRSLWTWRPAGTPCSVFQVYIDQAMKAI